MSLKLQNPGCNCCCDIFADNFNRSSLGSNWTQDAGTWTMQPIGAETSVATDSTDARLVTVPTSSNAAGHYVVAKLSQLNVGLKARVLLKFQDSSNYLYVEFRPLAAPSNSDLILGNAGGALKSVTIDPTSATTFTIVACWNADDEKFSAIVYEGDFGTLLGNTSRSSTTAPASGNKAGVGTGDTVTSQIRFDDFDWDEHKRGENDCPQCKLPGACGPNILVTGCEYPNDLFITIPTLTDVFCTNTNLCAPSTNCDHCADYLPGTWTMELCTVQNFGCAFNWTFPPPPNVICAWENWLADDDPIPCYGGGPIPHTTDFLEFAGRYIAFALYLVERDFVANLYRWDLWLLAGRNFGGGTYLDLHWRTTDFDASAEDCQSFSRTAHWYPDGEAALCKTTLAATVFV